LHRTALSPVAAATGSSVLLPSFDIDTNVSTQLNRSEWAQVLWPPWLLYLTVNGTGDVASRQRRNGGIHALVLGSILCGCEITLTRTACVWAAQHPLSLLLPLLLLLSLQSLLLLSVHDGTGDFCFVFVSVFVLWLLLLPSARGLGETATCCTELAKCPQIYRKLPIINALRSPESR